MAEKVLTNVHIKQDDEHDVVWGAKAIGKVINRDEHAVAHLIQQKAIPVTKVGGVHCASKRKLLAVVNGEAA